MFRSPGRMVRALLPWVADALAWTFGLALTVTARHEFDLLSVSVTGTAIAVLIAVTFHTLAGHVQYLYRGRHPFGSFREVRAVFLTFAGTDAILIGVDLLTKPRPVPLSAAILGGPLALIPMLAVRYLRRLHRERSRRPDVHKAKPALLFGAGDAATQLVASMLTDPDGRYVPVGLLDDDPESRHREIHGVRVLGGRSELAAAVEQTGAEAVIFAVSNADAALVREVRRSSLAAGVSFQVVPSVSELLDGRVGVGDVRDVEIGDLLGPAPDRHRPRRHRRLPDRQARAGHRRRRFDRLGAVPADRPLRPARTHDARPRRVGPARRAAVAARAGAARRRADLILADIRDADAVRRRSSPNAGPQVVFHAAALKHLPLLERHPAEAVKTNVWGTQTCSRRPSRPASNGSSTSPPTRRPTRSSVLGYSKRITERLTAHAGSPLAPARSSASASATCWAAAARCSPRSRPQIAAGGPITVTHPEVTRYFMTVQEAVQLVIQAAAIGARRRGLGARHGRAGAHRDVARQLADQAPGRRRDRLHRPAPGREAARGALRRRRARRAAATTR